MENKTFTFANTLKLGLYLAVLVGLVFYFSSHWGEITRGSFKISSLAVGVLFAGLVMMIRGLILKNFIFIFNGKTSTGKCVEICASATIVNLVLHLGIGSAMMVVFIRNATGKRFVEAGSVQLASLIYHIFADAFLGLLVLMIFYPEYGLLSLFFLSILLGIILSGMLVSLAHNRNIKVGFEFLDNIVATLSQCYRMEFFRRILPLCFIETLCLVGCVFFAFQAIGVDVESVASALYASIRNLSILLAITPGALGISEAVMGLSAQLFSVSEVQSVTTSMFIRVFILFSCLFVVSGFKFCRIIGQRNPDGGD